jgi:hypothetical protein
MEVPPDGSFLIFCSAGRLEGEAKDHLFIAPLVRLPGLQQRGWQNCSLFTEVLFKKAGDLAPGRCRFRRVVHDKVLCVRLSFENE